MLDRNDFVRDNVQFEQAFVTSRPSSLVFLMILLVLQPFAEQGYEPASVRCVIRFNQGCLAAQIPSLMQMAGRARLPYRLRVRVARNTAMVTIVEERIGMNISRGCFPDQFTAFQFLSLKGQSAIDVLDNNDGVIHNPSNSNRHGAQCHHIQCDVHEQGAQSVP